MILPWLFQEQRVRYNQKFYKDVFQEEDVLKQIEDSCSEPSLLELVQVRDVPQCCQNILYLKYYTLFWQNWRIILYLYFFSVKYLKTLYYRIKRSKVLYLCFFSLKYLIHVNSYRLMSISKKNLLAPSALVFGVSNYISVILHLYFI